MSLAAAVVAAIRPLLAGPAGAAEDELYQAVCARLAEDTYHRTVLRGVQDQPDNDCRIQSLIGALAEVVGSDPDFVARIGGVAITG